MSNRTLVELNHDFCPYTEEQEIAFGRDLAQYMRSGDIRFLPYGVVFKGYRNSGDPEFKVSQPRKQKS